MICRVDLELVYYDKGNKWRRVVEGRVVRGRARKVFFQKEFSWNCFLWKDGTWGINGTVKDIYR